MPEDSGGASASHPGAPRALGGVTTRASIAARIAARSAPLARRHSTNGNEAVAAVRPPTVTATAAPIYTSATDDVVALTPIRKRIAANLTHSLATAAHTLIVVEVDYSAVEAVRTAHGLSYLPFVGRAVVDALHRYPHVNASLADDALIVHRDIN